ncbi:iron-containing alcohol dehydrogenase [Xenorhabdus khoisanae]|uniref:iron-containing alcohol dehydrogenase n=1 Tax=Xenorhabdus khoisanae TaxID=880157 RepID=UPI002359E369|nr:iron-containing alcohol dehydrogenase [Xenorhabdus khoisanae]MDC9615904.1 iron-containing alcohol dehydrogenase [Xenorhabdus khoisanae]
MNINMSTKVKMGPNVVQDHINKNKRNKLLLIIDKNVANSEIASEIMSIASNSIIDYVENEPRVEEVNDIINKLDKVDLIYGIGGGSTMDLAKAVSVTITNGKQAEKLRGWGKVVNEGVPVIAVPTIPGTAAEFSATAVLKGNGYKLGINSPKVKPIEAVIDPIFFTTLTADIGIPVLLDSYIHSFESLEGIKGSRTSKISCKNVIDIFTEIFSDGYKNKDPCWNELAYYANYVSSFSLLEGSVGAVHALSYAISDSLGTCHSKANLAALEQLEDFFYKYVEKATSYCNKYNVEFRLKATENFDYNECITVMERARDRLDFLWINTIGEKYKPEMADRYINKVIESMTK